MSANTGRALFDDELRQACRRRGHRGSEGPCDRPRRQDPPRQQARARVEPERRRHPARLRSLANEYVVYSAHLDHLGITAPLDGDSINNGALDNASGIAAMLEVARALRRGKAADAARSSSSRRPARRRDCKGADYFANNPTVPASAIVADINIDEIFMFAPTRDVVPIGGEHSTLGDAVAHAAAKMNVEVSPDPQPEEVVFVRSDQYPFVKRGVPAVYIGSGYKPVDPKVDS